MNEPKNVTGKAGGGLAESGGSAAVSEYFRKLRFSEAHHLGLGDIRITMGQQEEIVEMVRRIGNEKQPNNQGERRAVSRRSATKGTMRKQNKSTDTAGSAFCSTVLLDSLRESRKCLKQLRALCESTARSGKHVREMSAYKNALGAEIMMESMVEEIAKIGRDRCSSVQSDVQRRA